MIKRDYWNEIDLRLAWPPKPQSTVITISTGQEPDAFHHACYDQGGIVLELDDDETPVRAFSKATT